MEKNTYLYKDKNQPIDIRVNDLLEKMTLKEKVAQLCSDLPVSMVFNGEVDMEALRENFKDGLGRVTQYSTVGLTSPKMIAKVSNQIQHYFMEETRLGIPVILQSENLCGYPGAGGTLFPSMINVASTFKPELAKEMAEIIGEETGAVGIKQAMSPVIDVSRDPRWGRTYETFGEDQYLISQMGINYVQGMQKDKNDGVACIAKHFLGYSETQGGLNMTATRLCERELYEVFATPFEAAAKEAELAGMMASYSEIDGIPVGANKKIIKNLLRDTMGYNGVLVSDGGAILKIFNYHRIGKTYEEAGFLAKRAGLDTEMPVGNAFRHLPEYVESGKLDESIIDASVRRILATKFQYGLFDNPYVDEEKVSVAMTNDKKWDAVEEITDESIILLKNDNNILPLKSNCKVAVIGPHGGSLREPLSGYSYPAYVEMITAMNSERKDNLDVSFNGMMDEAKKNDSESSIDPKKPRNKTPFTMDIFSDEDCMKLNDMESILKHEYKERTLVDVLGEKLSVAYAKGCSVVDESTDGFEEALETAKASDVVVMTLGGNCGWFDTTGGEGKDRSTLELPGVQQQLLEEVKKLGKPIILVLFGPGCFSVGWAKENVEAILQAWLPGARGAESLTKILLGELNPGGKLPVTIPRSVGQVPVYYNHKVGSGFESDKGAVIFGKGYVNESDTPLFPFGYGLSYTNFEISDYKIADHNVPTDGSIQVSCKVKNVGKFVGDEVVQLYYHYLDAWVTRPIKQLAGFKRVNLEPGEEKIIKFTLDTAQLGFYNEEMEFVVEPGAMSIMIGTSSADILFEEEIQLKGEAVHLLGKRKYTCKAEIL
ncbi:glycoside hydrolase family 3 N-terminal domain-containing protein [Clostridium saccharoperbutylacetonicum]